MPAIHDHIQLEPGHYASIFISERPLDPTGYSDAMNVVMSHAENMDGYLGFEAIREGRDGIFISYWKDLASVQQWAEHGEHHAAKARGVSEWYDAFRVVVCQVEHTRWFRRPVSPE